MSSGGSRAICSSVRGQSGGEEHKNQHKLIIKHDVAIPIPRPPLFFLIYLFVYMAANEQQTMGKAWEHLSHK